jgi:eukaryotic-like serine/threonine-protein kinase
VEAGRCPQCGTELLDAQEGLCPACLLKLGLSGVIAVEPQRFAEPAPVAPQHRKLLWIVAGMLLVALAILSLTFLRQRRPEQRLLKLFIPPPGKTTLGAIAISPNGRLLAFTATDHGRGAQLWIRPLDSTTAQPLPGTDGGSFPFWSPDSRYIGFFARGKLRNAAASGGGVQTVCAAPNGRGGAWNRENVILFAPAEGAPLSQVSASGGEPRTLANLNGSRKEISHRCLFSAR